MNGVFLSFSNDDAVFAHKRGTGLEMVHQIFVAEVTLVLHGIVDAIPWLDAYKWGVLPIWAPNTDGRGIKFDSYHGMLCIVQQTDLM